MSTANVEMIGTRSLAEIADRLVLAAADARETPLAAETARLVEDYVKIRSDAPGATAAIRALTKGALAPGKAAALDAALDAYDRRLQLLDAAGVDLAGATFSAEFGRNLEYYTGFVFEVLSPRLDGKSPLAGGGRYDSLFADVGAPQPIPAVGSSIHTERVLSALAGGPA